MQLTKKDNTTLSRKTSLRHSLLKKISSPVVLETHGGLGQVWKRVYSQIPQGVVFELDASKAEVLAAQRPSWSVYEANCITALRAGAGGHLECNVVDLDPYGEPWPIVEALFSSERPWPARLAIAINDGGRVKVQLTGAWEVKSLRPALEHFGIGFMYPQYLAVCRWNLERLARAQGYTMTDWTGYYCGKAGCMTHYGAVLERETKRGSPATKAPRRATRAKISATKGQKK